MKQHQKKLLSLALVFCFLQGCSTFQFYNVPVVQGNLYEQEDLDKLFEITKPEIEKIITLQKN